MLRRFSSRVNLKHHELLNSNNRVCIELPRGKAQEEELDTELPGVMLMVLLFYKVRMRIKLSRFSSSCGNG